MKKSYTFIGTLILCLFQFTTQAQPFNEVAIEVGVDIIQKDLMLMGGGCAFFDYDNDGYEDIFVTGGREADALYRNNGDGTFTNMIETSGIVKSDTLTSNGVGVGDINNDGCKDLFIGTMAGEFIQFLEHSPNLLFINNCDGTFTDITASSGLLNDLSFGMGASFGDVNLDGWLDIYTVGYIEQPGEGVDDDGNPIFAHIPQRNLLYINNGDNTFTESSAAYGVEDYGCTLAVAFTDFDQDSDVDLFVSNDFGYYVTPSAMYRNDYPSPQFSNAANETGINTEIYGMGIAIGDYDEDGDFDYYETNFGRNVLHQNQGDNTFLDKSTETGTGNEWIVINSTTTVGWATFFVDFDNNSYLDLFVGNGFMPSGDPAPISNIHNYDAYFYNNGDGTFTNVAAVLGLNNEWITRGAAKSDFDNDGDMDYMVVVLDEYGSSFDTIGNPMHNLLYRNDLDNNNYWVGFQLQGTEIIRDAYGSRVEVYADGRKFIQEVDGGSSHCSHNSSRLHFGLGNIPAIDSVKFMWLGGDEEILYNPPTNQYHHIIQGENIDPVSTINLNYNFNFNVFPTVFKNDFWVTMEMPKKLDVPFFIYDNRGVLVKKLDTQKLQIGEHEIHFNGLENLPAGIYYLKANIQGKVLSKKMIKY